MQNLPLHWIKLGLNSSLSTWIYSWKQKKHLSFSYNLFSLYQTHAGKFELIAQPNTKTVAHSLQHFWIKNLEEITTILISLKFNFKSQFKYVAWVSKEWFYCTYNRILLIVHLMLILFGKIRSSHYKMFWQELILNMRMKSWVNTCEELFLQNCRFEAKKLKIHSFTHTP